MDDIKAMALLEAFLFAAGDPIEKIKLADIMDLSEQKLELLLEQLKRRYQTDVLSGLRLTEIKDKVALSTKTKFGNELSSLFSSGNQQVLSQASYEVLAVIAYSEPVTRSEIEMVRGVNSDSIVSRLIDRGLVEQKGNLDVPGRPGLLYVTEQFLADFGLKSTQDLEPVDLLMYDKSNYHEDRSSVKETHVKKPLVIAIDGPSAAGKSTLARELASKLSILYLDTGAMYRALGLKALQQGLDMTDNEIIEKMLSQTELEVELAPEGQHTFVDGEDFTGLIRTAEVSQAASAISALSACRYYCVEKQRQLAKTQSLILDGRDIGTFVLPDAVVKFFISADPEVRARRRHKEMLEKDNTVCYEDVLSEIIERDHNDSNRALAPTRQAEDAILIDTTNRGIEDIVDEMLLIIKDKLNLA